MMQQTASTQEVLAMIAEAKAKLPIFKIQAQ